MFVPWFWHAEAALQVDLSGCRIDQVESTYDVSDALIKVIDNDGELVRDKAVFAPDNEIPYGALYPLHIAALKPISEADRLIVCQHANGVIALVAAVPAGARVYRAGFPDLSVDQ